MPQFANVCNNVLYTGRVVVVVVGVKERINAYTCSRNILTQLCSFECVSVHHFLVVRDKWRLML